MLRGMFCGLQNLHPPVQIRAAPPNFRFKFDGLCYRSTNRRLDYKS